MTTFPLSGDMGPISKLPLVFILLKIGLDIYVSVG